MLTTEQHELIINTAPGQCSRDFLMLLQETEVRPHEARTIAARHVAAVRHLWVSLPEEHKAGRNAGRRAPCHRETNRVERPCC